ncbi:MAG: nicotinate (nicotinamide) nucleotide adenylyltransferase [Rhodoferax sp.]
MSKVPDQARRIGVFGGAFDPPHLGHRALAQAALAQLQLDALRIIPTGQAWHKNRALTPAVHRLAMAQLAFAGLERVHIDPRETQRPGASYTVDTLRELHDEHPQAQLFLILGQDQAQALTSWHRWEEIPQLAIICVADRAGFSGGKGVFDALLPEVPNVRRLEMPPVDVSATDIRQHLANQQSVAPLVFEPVARYIALHHLYQTA